jgi:glycosyltransferase involved in cell wall biosynthesis
MMRVDTLVSVIAPIQDDGPILREFVTEVLQVLQEHYAHYELILVDDYSTDGTVDIVEDLMARAPGLRLIRLSRRFGTGIAIGAGLDTAIGDYVVVMRANSDPPGEIPAMIRATGRDCGVILGTSERQSTRGPLVRLGRAAAYSLIGRLLPTAPRGDATGFCVLSRRVVDAIARIKARYRHAGLLSCVVGYTVKHHSYQQIARTPRRDIRPLREAIGEMISLAITSSFFPLRAASAVGALAAGLNLAYVLYILLVNLLKRQVAEGWTTLSLQISGMFLFVFVNFIIISEYLARISHESRDEPHYHVLDERSSAVRIHDPGRRNVV